MSKSFTFSLNLVKFSQQKDLLDIDSEVQTIDISDQNQIRIRKKYPDLIRKHASSVFSLSVTRSVSHRYSLVYILPYTSIRNIAVHRIFQLQNIFLAFKTLFCYYSFCVECRLCESKNFVMCHNADL